MFMIRSNCKSYDKEEYLKYTLFECRNRVEVVTVIYAFANF